MSTIVRSNAELNDLANGKNLVVNGDFSQGLSNWAKEGTSDAATTIAVVDGRLLVTAATSYDGAATTVSGLIIGSTYEVSCGIELGTATSADLRLQGGLDVSMPAGTQIVVATDTYATMILRTSGSIGTVYFDNISIKEIPQVQGENLPDYVASRSNFGMKNHIVNGRFDVWQRGTSFSGSAEYSSDRWKTQTSGNLGTTTRSTDAPDMSRYSAKVVITGTAAFMQFGQQIEFANFYSMRGKTVTLSFWAKGVGITALTSRIREASTTEDEVALFTAQTLSAQIKTINTTWQKFTHTFTIGATATAISTDFSTGAVVSGNQIYIAQVQLELGSVATNFEKTDPTLEIIRCGYPADNTLGYTKDIPANRHTGFKNHIINGGFDVWQRGTSFNAYGYSADRWLVSPGNSIGSFTRVFSTLEKQLLGNPAMKFDCTTIGTAASTISHRIEGLEKYSGKTITVSFKITGTLNGSITLYGNYGSGGSTQEQLVSVKTIMQSGNYGLQTFTFTVPDLSAKTFGDSNFLWLYINIDNTQIGDFYISQVQLEEGSVATPFEQRPYGLELSLCQRYYEKASMVLTAVLSSFPTGYWKVEKRVPPTLSLNILFGSGATISTGTGSTRRDGFYQNVPNSQASACDITADAEL